jgi:parallel beta-helix repeat protein
MARFNHDGINILNSKSILLKNNDITYSERYGIAISHSNNGTIENNLCNLNENGGLKIHSLEYYNINNNTISLNGASGIYLRNSNNVIIDNNICEQNFNGIILQRSIENIIIENSANNNENGIHLSTSNNNEISNNDIIMNNSTGILVRSSNNNIISKNNFIANNVVEIEIDDESIGNLFYHNTILGYYFLVLDESEQNSWNLSYPGGGNYWGKYNGTDQKKGPNQDIEGSDGLGDQPYDFMIYEEIILDHYPLMEPRTEYHYVSIPFEPDNLTIRPGKNSVILEWSAPIHTGQSPIIGYNVYRTDPGSFNRKLMVKLGNETQFIDRDVKEGKLYSYNITAENDYGEGPSSEDIEIEPIFLPDEVDNDSNIQDVFKPLQSGLGMLIIILLIIIIIYSWLSRRRTQKKPNDDKMKLNTDSEEKSEVYDDKKIKK